MMEINPNKTIDPKFAEFEKKLSTLFHLNQVQDKMVENLEDLYEIKEDSYMKAHPKER